MNNQKSSQTALDHALTLTVVGMQTKNITTNSPIGVASAYLSIFKALEKEFSETPAAESVTEK